MARQNQSPGIDLRRGVTPYDQPVVITEAHKGWAKGWLARLSPPRPDSKYAFERSWVQPSVDERNSIGNGILYYDTRGLADGIYEADSIYQGSENHRTFLRIQGGRVAALFGSRGEVQELLAEQHELGLAREQLERALALLHPDQRTELLREFLVGETPAGTLAAAEPTSRATATTNSGCLLLADPATLEPLLTPAGWELLRGLASAARPDPPVGVAQRPMPDNPSRIVCVISGLGDHAALTIEAMPGGGLRVSRG